LSGLIAHEIGHNFGAPHNNATRDAQGELTEDDLSDPDLCNKPGTHMENPLTTARFTWSTCANAHFQDHFNKNTKTCVNDGCEPRITDPSGSGAQIREFNEGTTMPYCLNEVEETMLEAFCGGAQNEQDEQAFINGFMMSGGMMAGGSGATIDGSNELLAIDDCNNRCHPTNTECIQCEGTDDPNCVPCASTFCEDTRTRFTCQCREGFRNETSNNPFIGPDNPKDDPTQGCLVCDINPCPEDINEVDTDDQK